MKPVVLAAAGALLAVAGLLGPASAADMPEYPVIDTPEPLPIAVGGWYLRGDIGYKIYEDPDGHFDAAGFGNMFGEKLDDTGVVGVGVGYKFNDYLRFDTTLDYEFKSGFEGSLECAGPCAGASDETADLDAWTGLVNAYVDIGTWYGFTPYVGAGIGASYLHVSNTASDPVSAATYGGDGEWNFAWALMAGTSFQMTDNLLLDLNYRYLNLGDAQSGPVTGYTDRIEYDNIAAHEIRVGLRYNLF